eukprot:CAMPEP_0171480468 /NCGR_PEP_ID=MMETSP0946-20130122/6083_1 /TAXON_ID=109269 /ORGANISM="Vaucheria litorea, Strain CCMP2940" /LENGTH=150 /DNA_ID=CAMNT_0012011685 /DNA_START=58 /DNA_END=511 /DNA_ORIENTATION=+
MSRARASSSELKLEEKRKDMDSPHIGKKVSSFKKAQSKLSQQNWLKMSKNRSSMLTTPELIHPSPNNIARKSDSYSAVFNLVASIFGGSILTLPSLFNKLGSFSEQSFYCAADMRPISAFTFSACAQGEQGLSHIFKLQGMRMAQLEAGL